MVAANTICTACDRTLRPGLVCGDKVYTCESSSGCPNVLCPTCFVQRPLYIVDPDVQTNASVNNNTDGRTKNNGNKNNMDAGQIRRLCRHCFEMRSTLCFDRPSYEYQPSTSGTTFVFCHGASGCRQMFAPYAEYLHQHHQHGYILLDLPGHGTCVDIPLSLDSSVQCIQETLTACQIIGNNNNNSNHHPTEKLIYVGGSLGAYLGFHVLSELVSKKNDVKTEDPQQQQQHEPPYPHCPFVGAVLMDCGQNVGPGCGPAARLGLVVLKLLATQMSNYALMKMMLSVTRKSPANYHLIECVYGAGMWFDQGGAHIQCLQQVAPATLIPRIPIPILYMNGSLDHRDSETTWLNLSAPQSSLKVYEGGDHFFTHDSRFVDDILASMVEFEKGLCQVE